MTDSPLPPHESANGSNGAYEPWLHVVLHEPEIAYNTGSVGRTCVALGAKLWLVRPLGFTIDDRQLRRAGLDYWPHLAWEPVDDWRALCDRLPTERAWCFTKRGDRPFVGAEFRRGDVLVFGSESRGLPPSILESAAGRRLRVPTRPEVRSLNLSNTVAIAGYEALRQVGGAAEIAGLAEAFPDDGSA